MLYSGRTAFAGLGRLQIITNKFHMEFIYVFQSNTFVINFKCETSLSQRNFDPICGFDARVFDTCALSVQLRSCIKVPSTWESLVIRLKCLIIRHHWQWFFPQFGCNSQDYRVKFLIKLLDFVKQTEHVFVVHGGMNLLEISSRHKLYYQQKSVFDFDWKSKVFGLEKEHTSG